MSYWERLKFLKMYSQERRMERYRAIYVWKILEGCVPNCGLLETYSERRGREVAIPAIRGRGKLQTIREGSFTIHGSKVFNSLPKEIRNLSRISVDDFKSKLDKYLETLPDEPKVGDYTPSACSQVTMAPSNSIIDLGRTVTKRKPG